MRVYYDSIYESSGMELLNFFIWINSACALPSTILFFGAGVLLTIKTGFIQIRAFPRFMRLLINGVKRRSTHQGAHGMQTIGTFHALFTAMGTTIGMGNIVGPSLAIIAGGPGALFWLWIYIFFGSVTKFTEVAFALETRQTLPDGHIIGGPMRYLQFVSTFLASWYSIVMTFLFVGWSAIQSNTLAQIYAQESIPEWAVGLLLALFVGAILQGGAQRVGDWATALVPAMCLFYITFALIILLQDIGALHHAFQAIFAHAFSSTAAVGGFAGATLIATMRTGIFKAIFITEAGLGTSSIPHALADTQRPTDQGVLAMFSMFSDAFLCTLSGLMTLVTGIWLDGEFRSTLVYEVFKMHSPHMGGYILLMSITLFVVTTVIGNSFSGTESFSALTRHKWVGWYILLTMCMIFIGSMLHVRLAWEMMDTFLMLVAIPNILGLLILAFRRPEVLKR